MLWTRIQIRSIGPPGSRSVIICTDPDPDLDPSINMEKKVRKILISTIFLNFFFDFLSVKTDVNVPSKSIRRKNLEKTLFLLPSCQPLLKKAGSRESGSVSQCYGYADPDPYQHATDPQHG